MTGGWRLTTTLICALASTSAAQSAQPITRPPGAGSPAAADQLFADGRFADAAAGYEQAVAAEPSATSLAGLARIRLYQHREDEAIALARKALTLAPDNMLAAQVLKTADSRDAAFGHDSYRIGVFSAVKSVGFVVTDPLPVVHVRIDDQPAAFLLDTGAPDIALKPAFAKALGLPLTAGGIGTFAGGRHAQVERTSVPGLEIGGIHVSNVPAAINPAELPGLHTDGVIGTGLLMHFLSTIDYCRGRLVLAPRGTSADFERRAAASGANIVPMWLVGDHFIFARAEINRVEGLYNIDTGLAGGGLVATKSTLEAAHIVVDEGNASTGQGGGGAVRFVPFRASARLGGLARDDVPGVYMSDGDPYAIFQFKVAGALSHSFFRRSRVTFDFEAMKLVTETCED